MSPHRSRVVLASLFFFCVIGCMQEPVREDRSIQTAKHTDAVTFQHGERGVFLRDAGQLRQIFEPHEGVLATSTPLISPRDDRMIFCTAEPLVEETSEEVPPTLRASDWDASPQGRIYGRHPVRYTCWLREAQSEDAKVAPAPTQLFTAVCGHPGYIAANLAARWCPDAQGVWFIEQTTGIG